KQRWWQNDYPKGSPPAAQPVAKGALSITTTTGTPPPPGHPSPRLAAPAPPAEPAASISPAAPARMARPATPLMEQAVGARSDEAKLANAAPKEAAIRLK